MDIGRIIIFIVIISICINKYLKTRKDTYIFMGVFSWLGTLYMSSFNLYQYLPSLLRVFVNGISVILILISSFLYFKEKIKNYKNIDKVKK